MRLTIARAIVVLALCLSIGAHWGALQSVAWATMIVEYSQHAPLVKAVAETFDGNHPCELCKHIKLGQQSEKKPESKSTTVKLDLLCVRRAIVLRRPSTDSSFAREQMSVSAEAPSPPVPPPRSLLV